MGLLLSAILPVAIFLYFIYRKDTSKEPWQLLLKCLGFGMLGSIPAIIIELILGVGNIFSSAFLSSFYEAFIEAALTEETIKFLILYWLIRKNKNFDQHYDGIVYAVFVSLGFALVENIMYVLQDGYATAITRAVLSVPGHGLFGVIMGYFFALAKFSDTEKRKKYMCLSLLIPIILHGIYDFFLMYTTENSAISLFLVVALIALMIFVWIYAIKNLKKHLAHDMKH
jgi:RsiW-degrading membrane proteinase PrsW (M82 family)